MAKKKPTPKTSSHSLSAILKAMTVTIVDPDESNLTRGSEAAQFYAHLGRVIAMWANIEGLIFELFVFSLVIDRYKASILFEKLATIGPKINMADAILAVSLNNSWYIKWKKIYTDLETLLPFRNQIAHNPIGKIAELQINSAPVFRYYSHTHRMKLHKNDNFAADINDIKNHIQELSSVLKAMSSLGIPKHARRLPAKPETPRSPLALGSKGSQTKRKTRATQRPPPRSSPA